MKSKPLKYVIYTIVVIISLCVITTIINTIRIKSSEQYEIAKEYIRSDKEIIKKYGKINSFGLFPKGAIVWKNGKNYTRIETSIEGKIKRGDIILLMEKVEGQWIITDIYM